MLSVVSQKEPWKEQKSYFWGSWFTVMTATKMNTGCIRSEVTSHTRMFWYAHKWNATETETPKISCTLNRTCLVWCTTYVFSNQYVQRDACKISIIVKFTTVTSIDPRWLKTNYIFKHVLQEVFDGRRHYFGNNNSNTVARSLIRIEMCVQKALISHVLVWFSMMK